MKKFVVAFGLLCSAFLGHSQTAALPVYACTLPGVQALTQGLTSSNYLYGVIPSCTVTVYLTGTTTIPTTSPQSPFTANVNGSIPPIYAATGIGYDVVLSGGISPNTYPLPVTLTDVFAGGGGGGAGNTTVVAIGTPSVRSGIQQSYDSIPSVTPEADIRAYGAHIDGTTAIDTAAQAAITNATNISGGAPSALLPCVGAGGAAGCLLQNGTTLTSSRSVKLNLQGGLQLSSTLALPATLSLYGDGGSSPTQFQTGTTPAVIHGPLCFGTLGTAITTPAIANVITPTFTGNVYSGGPACSIANLPVGSAITIAATSTVTATASRVTDGSYGLTTYTFSSALRVPPGEIVSVTSCSDSSFNVSNIAVDTSDYTAKTIQVSQTDNTAASGVTGCQVTGFNEDAYESARVVCSNGTGGTFNGFNFGTSGTFNGSSYSACGAGQITILTSHTHSSTDKWGEVAVGPAFNTAYQPQTWKDVNIDSCAGMCFWAEGSTNLVLDHVAAVAGNYMTSGPIECSACYNNQFHSIWPETTQFGQTVPVCPSGGCTQPSYPYALRGDSDVTGFYYNSTGAGMRDTDIDFGSGVISGCLKIDGSGILNRSITGLPHIHSFTSEECWGQGIVTIDNRYGITSPDCLSISDPFMQDNLSGFTVPLVAYTDGNIYPTGCVAIENGDLFGNPLTNSYFNGALTDTMTEEPNFQVPLNETAPSATYLQGNTTTTELPNVGSGFGPQILPFGSLPVTGFSQTALAAACVSFGCTATSAPGPDGPSGQMKAVQIVSAGSGGGAVIATQTIATYALDKIIYGSWVRPIPGQDFTSGTGNSGANNSFYIAGPYDTFAATNCGTVSCSAAFSWPQAFGTGIAYNGWTPQVSVATILTGDSTPHAVELAIGVGSPSGLGNQWAQPFWAFIPGPNNPACTAAGTCNLSADQIEEARRDMYHGFVPPGMSAGVAATGEPTQTGYPSKAANSSGTQEGICLADGTNCPSGGNMGDGTGTSTAGEYPVSTTTPHSYNLQTASALLTAIGGAPAVTCTTISSLSPANGGCYKLSSSSSVATPAASTFSIFRITTATSVTATLTGTTIADGGNCSSYISGTTLAVTGNETVTVQSDGTNVWATCTVAAGTGTVTAVTGTAPVASSGGTTPAISMHVADASDNGYLASTDWSTFNGKQAALSLIKGTYVDGDLCSYTASGTLLNCNTAQYTLPSQYKTWSCQPGIGDGYDQYAIETYNVMECWNTTGATVTINAISCYVDAGVSTLQVYDYNGTTNVATILSSAVTCAAPAAAGSISGTTYALASGHNLKFTYTVTGADGTNSTWIVGGTY